jgi:ArsR family transcriptional regulator
LISRSTLIFSYLADEIYFDNNRHMSISTAVSRLSALAQDSRLLIEQGRDGLAAGKIAKQLHALYNTLSTDLALLTRASLLASTRRGRSIIYSIDLKGIQALFDCLVQDCCGGRPELCAPLTATILKTLPQQ